MQETFTQHLPVAREVLFAFHEDPAHLIDLLSGWKYSRVVKHEGHIRAGARLDIIEHVGPFRVPLTFEHTLYDPPSRFGEHQVEGPFLVFEHVHEFESTSDGTAIHDHVRIELPLWKGGELAVRLFIRPRMVRFFAFRHASLARLLQDGAIPGAGPCER
jgi:ligand-binding SRPBCC domain-containing protein